MFAKPPRSRPRYNASSDEEEEGSSEDGGQRQASPKQDTFLELINNNQYYRAIRYILVMLLFAMAILTLTIYTTSLERDGGRHLPVLLVALSNMALVSLGLYSVYLVKIGYSFLFAILHLLLTVQTLGSESFQANQFESILLHTPHFAVLFLSWAFSCMSLYKTFSTDDHH